ncbi:unnamed protein product [Eruca vesicaria subsp. sativa]|uniref:MBD domain-containing protein n=1 Tax=Eruca vesicaria subsp. sativa TaxID=29727 RepID=A0ABC8IZV6_ERUVS|nr:unnamed protein product [Eruca vesicaria subsp. sativa]
MQTRRLPEDDLVPLVKFPPRHRREPQLFIVDPTPSRKKKTSTSRKSVVKRRQPSSPKRKRNLDTCSNETGTGREIVYVEPVQRHLLGERRLSRSITFYERRRTEQDHRRASKDFLLPQGWTVKEVQRRNSSHIDKYYTEQETGKRFRSLVSIERYLNDVASFSKVHSEQVPLLAICGIEYDTVVVDQNPPEKVKSVLKGPEGDMFRAHVSERL